MSDIIHRFKNVFLSIKNSDYLFNIIINKLNQKKIYITENLDLYKQNFLELKNMIFDDYFINIYNDLFNINQNVNLEDVLIKLNQIAVSKFEYILSQEYIQKQYLHQVQNNNTNTNNNINNTNNNINNTNNNTNNANNSTKNNSINGKQLKVNNKKHENNKNNNTENNKNKNTENKNTENNKSKNNENKTKFNKKLVNKYTITDDNGNLTNSNLLDADYKINFINFFSDDAEFSNGKYSYNINISNLKSVYLESINLLYDMYNITNYNNKFYLLEETHKHLITIPIGFYSIDKLLEIITKTINYVSINKNQDYKYVFYKNKIKNKIYITCEWIKTSDHKQLQEKYKDKTVLNFGIIFISNNIPKINYSLNEILGFNNYEYLNNNVYISENVPIENIYQNIYFKIFINDKEIQRYYTTKQNFSYYDKITLDLHNIHGNKIIHKPNITTPYDIEEEIEMNTITFQFNNSTIYNLTNFLNFDITIGFEYI